MSKQRSLYHLNAAKLEDPQLNRLISQSHPRKTEQSQFTSRKYDHQSNSTSSFSNINYSVGGAELPQWNSARAGTEPPPLPHEPTSQDRRPTAKPRRRRPQRATSTSNSNSGRSWTGVESSLDSSRPQTDRSTPEQRQHSSGKREEEGGLAEIVQVQLDVGPNGFGFSIGSAAAAAESGNSSNSSHHPTDLIVMRITPGGPADKPNGLW